MTKLYVNNQEIAPPPPSISSLEQIIKHVEDNLLPPNAVIKQVNLDGSPIDASASQNDPALLLGDLTQREKIEIFTCTLKEIALDSIREASSYLERAETLTPSIASSFRDFPGPEAFETLKQLYDGFYWLTMLLDRLELVFKIDLDGTVVSGTSIREYHQKFLSILKQLVTAQEQEDFILIGDLLEFELIPIIPVWKSLFADIATVASGT
jgi:hypothetical protein